MKLDYSFRGLFKSPQPRATPVPSTDPPPTPPQGEVAIALRPFLTGQKLFRDYGGDDFKTRKGFDIYEKMLRDPQVKAVFNLKRDLIVNRDWRFVRPDDTPLQRRIEDFFVWNLESGMRGSWLMSLKTILMSVANGFSVTEKIIEPVVWNRADKWKLAQLKGRPAASFILERDLYGNVGKLLQFVISQWLELDPKRFVIHLTNADLDPIYGVSDLQAAYRPYWEKDIISKLHSIYLERLAAGFVWVELANPLSPAEELDLRDILKNITAQTAVIAPKGATAQVIHGIQTDAFEKAITQKNEEIAKALMVPSLLGFTEQGRVGSFGQATIQMSMFFLHLRSEGQSLEDTINEHIFKELALWNFGAREYPQFRFDPFAESEKQAIVKAWNDATKAGTVSPQPHDEDRVRKLLGFELPNDSLPPAPPGRAVGGLQ